MKKSKIFLALIIIATAAVSAVNIFSDRAVKVSTDTVKKEAYAPYLVFSGSVSAPEQNGEYSYVMAENTYVSVLVGESNISSIEKGQKAEITGSGFKGKYSAEVISVGKSAKKITVGTTKAVVVDVVLKIDQPDDSIKSGFTAKAKIFTDKEENVLTVPYSAIMQQNDEQYVMVVKDGIAERKDVKTGRELANGCEILEGLLEGEVVITSPQSVKNGSKVTQGGEN